MSAEILRQAAEKMRERAAEADYGDGPWCPAYLASSIRNMQRNCDWDCPEHEPWDGPDSTEDCAQPSRYAGEHIASWHPGVARAVADSLIAAAAHIESHDCEAHCEPDGCELVLTATRTARTYLAAPPEATP